MADTAILNLSVKLKVDLSLWQAIKLRLAGPDVRGPIIEALRASLATVGAKSE